MVRLAAMAGSTAKTGLLRWQLPLLLQLLLLLPACCPAWAVQLVADDARQSWLRPTGLRGPSSVALATATLLARSQEAAYRERMENALNMQYFINIEIGGQAVPAILDSGSFDLLVLSKNCTSCGETVYDPAASKTFHAVLPQQKVEHVFGSGSTESVLALEDLQIGPWPVKNFSFYEVVDHEMDVLIRASFDAIVGVGPEEANATRPSLLQKLKLTHFSLCLERAPGSPGWFTWGDALTAEQKSQAAELRIIGERHWTVSMTNVMPAVNMTAKEHDAAQTLLCGRGCAAILDSGTSLLVAPSAALSALERLLPAIEQDCSNLDQLPDLHITLDGYALQLPPEAFTLRLQGSALEKVQALELLYFGKSKLTPGREITDREDVCTYAFQDMDFHTDYGPMWIMGMPFFRFFHTTFELNRRGPGNDRHVLLMGTSQLGCEPVAPDAKQPAAPAPGESRPDPPRYDGVGVAPEIVVTQQGRNADRRVAGLPGSIPNGLQHLTSRTSATGTSATRRVVDPLMVAARAVRPVRRDLGGRL